ncbi:MAG: gamma-glutamyl-gamma-aminobutyrate hydrolase family protein, partial [Chitinophagales bacterium]
TSGEVNSAHHQSADKIGEGLKPNAFSIEKIIEGLELNANHNEPGMLLVQWHPERMKNQQSSFAGNIREWLINEAWKWK